MSCRGLLLVALAAALAAPAYGQWNGRGGPRNRNLKGTIGAIANGALKVETEGDQSQTVLVTMTAGTKLHYSGTATVEFLRPKLAVEFTAELDEKHNAKAPVTQLKIISLTGKRVAGLFPEGSESGAKPAEASNFGFGPGSGEKDADPSPAEKETKPAPRPGDAAQGPGTYVVRGTIKGVRAGTLTLKIGRETLKVDMADDAEIGVDTTDLSFARVGDSISVRGQGARQMIAATSVTVEGAEPLTGPKRRALPAAKKDSAAKKGSPAKKDSAAKKDDSAGNGEELWPDK
ncbi:MAG: hypothetical protein ACLQLG_20000 [Thermoguttaceae bacterium]